MYIEDISLNILKKLFNERKTSYLYNNNKVLI
ncbi:MAG: hypothetical protein FD166_1144 [Bacteroidetes bacterium]|nr:MAG: hypothetical protein FD166_1144 [Bacteroidota bacterium]